MNPFQNRYGYDVKLEWVGRLELVVNVPDSLFFRESMNDDGTLSFADFEGGPFIQVGSKILFPDRKVEVVAITKEEVGGIRLLFKDI